MGDEKYKRAQQRVKELKGFYSNLISYLTINVVLAIINLLTSPSQLWFYWVTIFWGIGLLFHALRVFTIRGKFKGEEWEKKKIDEMMKKGESDGSR